MDVERMKNQILNRAAIAISILAFCVANSLALNVDPIRRFLGPQVSSNISLADMQSDIVSVRSLIAAGNIKKAKAMVIGFKRRYPKYDIFKHAEFALFAQNNPLEWERRARKTISSIRNDASALLNFCITCSSVVNIGASPDVIKKGVEMVLEVARGDPAVLFFAGVFYVKVGETGKASTLFYQASNLLSGEGKKANRLLKSQIEAAKKNLGQLKGI